MLVECSEPVACGDFGSTLASLAPVLLMDISEPPEGGPSLGMEDAGVAREPDDVREPAVCLMGCAVAGLGMGPETTQSCCLTPRAVMRS